MSPCPFHRMLSVDKVRGQTNRLPEYRGGWGKVKVKAEIGVGSGIGVGTRLRVGVMGRAGVGVNG